MKNQHVVLFGVNSIHSGVLFAGLLSTHSTEKRKKLLNHAPHFFFVRVSLTNYQPKLFEGRNNYFKLIWYCCFVQRWSLSYLPHRQLT